MLEIANNGVRDTDDGEFYDYKFMSKKDYNKIINRLQEELSMAENDLDFVKQKMEIKFPPTRSPIKSQDDIEDIRNTIKRGFTAQVERVD